MRAFGPSDTRPRPAVLLFHGCGGTGPHLPVYARAAADAGARAFMINSYAARGWSDDFAQPLVCTGVTFWGRERAGDVLAAAWGMGARPDVDRGRLALAGWSHGGWSIMDLMTMPLASSGEAGLSNPTAWPIERVRGVFVAYPYGGPGALSRHRLWRRTPRVLGIIAGGDRITSLRDARRLYESPRRAGARVDLWEVPGAAHAFDEPGSLFSTRYQPGLHRQAVARFTSFLREVLR